MRTRSEIIRIAVERLFDVFLSFERSDAPSPPEPLEPPEPPPKPRGPKPGTQEWFRQLPAPRSDPDAVSMNAIARSAGKPRPPTGPGQQTHRYSSGGWWYW